MTEEEAEEILEPDGRLVELINKIRSEKENDVPVDKREDRTVLLDAIKTLNGMCILHFDEELARRRFEATERTYGQDREDIIKFTDHLEERLERYFARPDEENEEKESSITREMRIEIEREIAEARAVLKIAKALKMIDEDGAWQGILED